ncbi:unnamed protein product, partial [Sphacelaria rigidula]
VDEQITPVGNVDTALGMSEEKFGIDNESGDVHDGSVEQSGSPRSGGGGDRDSRNRDDGDGDGKDFSSQHLEYKPPVLPAASFGLIPVGSSPIPVGSWDTSPVASRGSRESTANARGSVSDGRRSSDGQGPSVMDPWEQRGITQTPSLQLQPPPPTSGVSRHDDAVRMRPNEGLEVAVGGNLYETWNRELGVGRDGGSAAFDLSGTRGRYSTVTAKGTEDFVPSDSKSGPTGASAPRITAARLPRESEIRPKFVGDNALDTNAGAPPWHRSTDDIAKSTTSSTPFFTTRSEQTPFTSTNGATQYDRPPLHQQQQHLHGFTPGGGVKSAADGSVVSKDEPSLPASKSLSHREDRGAPTSDNSQNFLVTPFTVATEAH